MKKHPYGMTYFEDFTGATYGLAYAAGYNKVAPTTTASGLGYLVTEGTNARLTYTGPGEVMDVLLNISLDLSVGANFDLRIALYKNGTTRIPGGTGIITTTAGQKRFLSAEAVVSLATNDYIECFIQNDGGSGTIKIYTFALYMDPH